MTELKLGKKPARRGAMKLKLRDYLEPTNLPTLPTRFGNLKAWTTWQWGMLGNDTAGCCVYSGFGHQCMAWGGMLGNMDVSFTTAQILGPGGYGETGYVVGDDSTDNGTDMVQACQWWKDKGFLGHTIKGFAQVAPASIPLAAFIFGSVGMGIVVQQAQMDQFDHAEPWDVVKDSPELGGHYVPVIGRNAAGNLLCVTWGRVQAVTPAFVEAQCDEAVVQLSADWLDAQQQSPRGLKLADMMDDMNTMSNS